jgi:hypothetical protein
VSHPASLLSESFVPLVVLVVLFFLIQGERLARRSLFLSASSDRKRLRPFIFLVEVVVLR